MLNTQYLSFFLFLYRWRNSDLCFLQQSMRRPAAWWTTIALLSLWKIVRSVHLSNEGSPGPPGPLFLPFPPFFSMICKRGASEHLHPPWQWCRATCCPADQMCCLESKEAMQGIMCLYCPSLVLSPSSFIISANAWIIWI